MPSSDSSPVRCADVTWDMRGKDAGLSAADADLGDLLWNPKGPEGHVLVAEVKCGKPLRRGRYATLPANCGCDGYGQWPCPSTTLVCECGQDGSWRDHHYELLARKDAG